MPYFVDAASRVWELEITVGLMGRLKVSGLDLDTVWAEGLAKVVFLDRATAGAILWTLCRRDAEAVGLRTRTAFFEDIDAAAMTGAGRALLDAVIDFFPNVNDVPYQMRGGTCDEGEKPEREDLLRACERLAGEVGIDPRPHSYRSLYRMATGKRAANAEIALFAARVAGIAARGGNTSKIGNPWAVVPPWTPKRDRQEAAEEFSLFIKSLRSKPKPTPKQ